MKFTNGYWLMRDNIEPLFAVEYADHGIQGDQLTVYAATAMSTTGGIVSTADFSLFVSQVPWKM